jgi:class 3 adenylate cyclase
MIQEPALSLLEIQPKAEMAHVLFTDVVGYSKRPSDEQSRLIQQLRQVVRNSVEYNRAHDDHSLICLPTGDGMALVFFESDVCAPVRAAIEISAALRKGTDISIRMGLHTGLVYRVPDINGAENVSGAGINFAQRVMDCGDAGHILMSQVHASFLCEFDALRPHLHDLGEAEVKHGVRIQLVNYFDGTAGQAAPPAKLLHSGKVALPVTKEKRSSSCVGAKVALIYKRNVEPDATLLQALEAELTRQGCEVFIDRHLQVGLNWAREIERALRASDAVIPLLSPTAVTSEMLAFELEIADSAAQQQGGRPRLLPVRINWEGPLPEGLTTILNSIQYTLWRGPEDTATVVAELTAALAEPEPSPTRSTVLEPPGGAMPLDSQYYVERPTDAEFHAAIERRDSIVLVEGARQMGKTSLLSRGLQRARATGARVTCTDFQKLNVSDLTSLESFFITLGTALANQLDLEKFPEDTWRPKSGPNQNFESYLRREVLGSIRRPLIWALDEVDRLFSCPFGSEVFGLFRSWHNARALDPESPWRALTLVICYATEAHLFITDLNQSPFNVGTRVRLKDFGSTEVRYLNELYGQPLKGSGEIERFMQLLGGQPYLVRRGMHEMVVRGIPMAELERLAPTEEGPFADHLKRFLVLLSRNEAALQFLREALSGRQNSDAKLFHRLRAAGLLRGEAPADAAFRCELYAQYLRRHLT